METKTTTTTTKGSMKGRWNKEEMKIAKGRITKRDMTLKVRMRKGDKSEKDWETEREEEK